MIVAILVLDAPFPKPINCIGISHPHKWAGGLHKLRVRFLDSVSGNRILQGQIDDAANEMFQMIQEVTERNEVKFTLDVCVFRELLVLY